MLMWPLVKKQLHQAKAMRELQPEIKKVKAASKGNKQQESQMLMELYKEKEISPFGSLGTLVIQFIVLIGLYSGLRGVISNPELLVKNSYSFVANLSWIKELSANIHLFDPTLLGFVNLSKSALGHGGVYWPAMIIVLASAITQYYSSKQLLPDQKEKKGLRAILKDAGQGNKADTSDVNAAVGRSTRYFIPVLIFLFTVNIASALSLYWFVGGLIAFLQQAYILRQDEEEMEVIADAPTKTKSKSGRTVVEAEVITKTPTNTSKKKTAKKSSKNKRKKK
jgi:YidC/Oxa1 family membrane protein insertase